LGNLRTIDEGPVTSFLVLHPAPTAHVKLVPRLFSGFPVVSPDLVLHFIPDFQVLVRPVVVPVVGEVPHPVWDVLMIDDLPVDVLVVINALEPLVGVLVDHIREVSVFGGVVCPVLGDLVVPYFYSWARRLYPVWNLVYQNEARGVILIILYVHP